jgi:hypothetical protein
LAVDNLGERKNTPVIGSPVQQNGVKDLEKSFLKDINLTFLNAR